jgi:hypothetical protein
MNKNKNYVYTEHVTIGLRSSSVTHHGGARDVGCLPASKYAGATSYILRAVHMSASALHMWELYFSVPLQTFRIFH